MASNKWKRDPVLGQSEIFVGSLDERFLDDAGRYNPDVFSDCNTHGLHNIPRDCGWTGAQKDFRRRVLPETSSYMHLHPITDVDGKVVDYATAVDSGKQGVKDYREAANKKKKQNLKQNCSINLGKY